MKLNWAERWAVNNPMRVVEQGLELGWMKRKATLAPGAFALEIGCGRGAGAALILKEFQPARLHAMDLDEAMIRKAGRYLPAEIRHRIVMYAGDVEHLPYADETLDAVFGFGVLHHVPNWRGALQEIVRVLKRGGIYFLEELYPTLYQNAVTRHILLHPTHDRFNSRDLKEAFATAHLAVRDTLEFRMVGILALLEKTA